MTEGTRPVDPLSPDEIRTLRAICKAFSRDELRVLKALARGVVGMNAPQGGASGGRAVADAAELDSRFGDPQVRRDPKRWAGDSYAGARYSQCPTDYLLCMAEQLEYFAEKDQRKPDAKKSAKGVPYWEYNLKDAARARGWAQRNKGRSLPPPVQQAAAAGDDDGAGDAYEGADDASDEWTP